MKKEEKFNNVIAYYRDRGNNTIQCKNSLECNVYESISERYF